MPETRQSKVHGIESWLQDRIGGEVAPYRDDKRRVTCFRVEGLDIRAEPVLCVHDEALDVVGLEKILKDLDQGLVPDRLRKHPSIRLRYTEKGVDRLFRNG